jgi:hypothetical protein
MLMLKHVSGGWDWPGGAIEDGETPAERAKRVVRIIRSRCLSVLSEDDLALVLKTWPKRRS